MTMTVRRFEGAFDFWIAELDGVRVAKGDWDWCWKVLEEEVGAMSMENIEEMHVNVTR